MSGGFRDTPFARLTRHFYASLFQFDLLTEAGVEAFERLIVGICSLFLCLGLVLTRLVIAKYATLSSRLEPELLVSAILSDHALVMAVPMWAGAVVAVLAGHAVFPDERDFRILMALPVPQRLIFRAKVTAVALFAGVFVVAIHAALAPVIAAIVYSRPPAASILGTIVSFGLASAAASAFALLAVIGLNGVLMLTATRQHLLGASAAIRSASLVGLVVLFPFVWKLSAMAAPLAHGAWWLPLLPPVWFLGIEQILAGQASPLMQQLGTIGVAAFAGVLMIVAATYAFLYRHFDRVMVRDSASRSGAASRRERERPERARGSDRPQSLRQRGIAAVQAFTFTTLRRSVLHQGVVVALGGIGLGVVVNGFVSMEGGAGRDELVAIALWAPFVLIFALCSAVRLSLSLPIDVRANWIFRMTEQQSTRVHQLRAPVRVMVTLGVALPVAALLPFQLALLGPAAFLAAGVTLLIGLLFVELLMKQWARIPFTCSYIPGKGFVPQIILTAFVVYILFTTIGAGLVRGTLSGRPGAIVALVFVAAMTLWLERQRAGRARETSLLFEDELPTEVNPLRLSD